MTLIDLNADQIETLEHGEVALVYIAGQSVSIIGDRFSDLDIQRLRSGEIISVDGVAYHNPDVEPDEEDDEPEPELLAALKAAGIVKVRAEFSGNGDEGFVNDISCYGPDAEDGSAVYVPTPGDLDEELFDHYISVAGFDGYEVNEGGEGFIVINVEAATAAVEMSYNEPVPQPVVMLKLGPDGAASGRNVGPPLANTGALGIDVTVTRSEKDGVPVVFIDTQGAPVNDAGEPAIRISLNDAHLFEGVPYPTTDEEVSTDAEVAGEVDG